MQDHKSELKIKNNLCCVYELIISVLYYLLNYPYEKNHRDIKKKISIIYIIVYIQYEKYNIKSFFSSRPMIDLSMIMFFICSKSLNIEQFLV